MYEFIHFPQTLLFFPLRFLPIVPWDPLAPVTEYGSAGIVAGMVLIEINGVNLVVMSKETFMANLKATPDLIYVSVSKRASPRPPRPA